MPVDPNVFNNAKTFIDYQRAQDEFDLKKQLAAIKLANGGADSLPASIQLADELGRARASGDTQRMNDLLMAAKSLDRGVMLGADNAATLIPGYGQSLGSLAASKEQGQKQVQLQYDPVIAGGEAAARLGQQLKYEPQIKAATDVATGNAKKGVQGSDALSIISDIESPDQFGKNLLDKASGSLTGATISKAKTLAGVSDETTQANAQLKVLGNRLILNVPRMEGPQSDKDAALYRAAAGAIADPSIPAGDKSAALVQIKKISEKYATPYDLGVRYLYDNPNDASVIQGTISKSDALNELRKREKMKGK